MGIPAFLLFIFYLISAFCFSSAQPQLVNRQNITIGFSLTPTSTTNSTWLSPSGLYAFGFYNQPNGGDGFYLGIFLAGIPEKTVVWTANRDDPPLSSNATLLFAPNGRLILQQPDKRNTTLIDAYSSSASASASASMLDSGNFVLYGSNGQPIWQSFEHPTDTILSTQRLSNNKELVSAESKTNPASGSFRLKMQRDGNLVQYPVQTPDTWPYAYYSSSTDGDGVNVTLNFENNGYLYLFDTTTIIKNITNDLADDGRSLYLMRLDPDGIFRVYSHTSNWSFVWSSTTDLCDPKGLCGLNAFCVLLDYKVDCRCLPGFDFVHTGNWSAGCERNFNDESCRSSSSNSNDTQTVVSAMISEANTVWEDVSYSDISLITQQACEQACLDDCNCEVALYNEGHCRKQRLPLRYGRRQMGDSNMVLVKTQTRTGYDGGTENNNVPPKQEKRHSGSGGVVFIIIGSSLVGLSAILLIVSGFLFYRSRLGSYKRVLPPPMGIVELGEEVAPRAFSYVELEKITNGFKHEVGKGASGVVYKGTIPYNGKPVAVKKLEKMSTEGDREFLNEIKAIGKTHHRNLVRLIGYCNDPTNKLLVIEFMSNGTLADVLFTPGKRPSWDERTRILLDIARGILYLHEECESQIIHCDIKPQNILMDEHESMKISDFGLAKLLKHDQTRTYTAPRGTRGYIAPEWHRNLPITVKVDVYSFGIVLLEIITCRKCLNWSLSEEEAVLENLVYCCYTRNELKRLVGDEDVDMKKMERMVKVGIWCIQDDPSLRPTMKKVLLMLEGTVDIPVPPCPSSFFSIVN